LKPEVTGTYPGTEKFGTWKMYSLRTRYGTYFICCSQGGRSS